MVSPRPTYRLATETTSRRFASMSRRLAIRPMTTNLSRSRASWLSRSEASRSRSSAKRPASTRRASSTSSAAVSSGIRPISRRYWRNRSDEGPPVSVRPRGTSTGSGASVSTSMTGDSSGSACEPSGSAAVSGWCAARLCGGTAAMTSESASVSPVLSVWVRVWVCTGATSRNVAAEACGSGTGTTALPLSVPNTLSGTAGTLDPSRSGRPRSEDSGTGTQCGVRHIVATRGVR
jgi:hypothetical protein